MKRPCTARTLFLHGPLHLVLAPDHMNITLCHYSSSLRLELARLFPEAGETAPAMSGRTRNQHGPHRLLWAGAGHTHRTTQRKGSQAWQQGTRSQTTAH